MGVQAQGSLGEDLGIWKGTRPWEYGYLRGVFNLASSAVVNRVGLELQFYPISIFGVSVGYDWGLRNFTPQYLDCVKYECRGRLDRFYGKWNALAAYQGVILSLNARLEHLHAFETPKPFFDEMSLLVGRSSGEAVFTLNPALLYRVNDLWKVGVTSLYSHAIDTGDYTHLYGPIFNYSWKPEYQLLAGAGLNRSPVIHSGITLFMSFQYTLSPSLSIADLPLRK